MRPFFPFTSVKFINVWCHSFSKRDPINMYKVFLKSTSLCINVYSWQLCLSLLNLYTHPPFLSFYSTPTESSTSSINFYEAACMWVCMPRTHIYGCIYTSLPIILQYQWLNNSTCFLYLIARAFPKKANDCLPGARLSYWAGTYLHCSGSAQGRNCTWERHSVSCLSLLLCETER